MGHSLHHRIEDILHAFSCLSAGINDVFQVAPDEVYDFVCHFFGHRIGHINLVDDRNDFEVMINSHIEIGNGLCLHSLCGIDDQQSSFACRYGTTHLIGEVHVSRSVDQVQDIFLALEFLFVTMICMLHLDGMTLDGNASLLLQVHIIKHLSLRYLDCVGFFQQSVCQGGLAVVNVCNNTKVSYILHNSVSTETESTSPANESAISSSV